jgi:prevent-host-death family protein
MTTVGIFEAKNRLSELVERAARGEEIVITRRGEHVARLMPPRAPDALGQAHALARRIRHSRSGQVQRRVEGEVQGEGCEGQGEVQGGVPGQLPRNGASIREMIEEGRR